MVSMISKLLTAVQVSLVKVRTFALYNCMQLYNYQCLLLICFYSLDPEQKDCLIEVIEKLLKDKTTVRNYLKPEMESLHVPSCVFIYLHDVIVLIAFTALNQEKRRAKTRNLFLNNCSQNVIHVYVIFSRILQRTLQYSVCPLA